MDGGGGGAAKEIINSLISGSRVRGDEDAEGRGGEREEEYDDDEEEEEEEDEGEEEEGSPFSTPSPPPAALMSTVVPVPLPQPHVSSSFIMSMSGGGGGGGGGGEDMSTNTTLMLLGGKKRGRPRKYGPDGMPPSPRSSSFSHTSSISDLSGKRTRGRPPGSGRRQLLATLGEWFACSAGGSFTPHVITIAAGEDVAARILSLSQKGPRAVCILSANGAISNVTLRQPGSSGGTLTYEGRFEILSLSGSFTITENSGVRSRTGGISVSLAGPDGRVVGGGVAGSLLAASPIQVVVGSFLPNAFKEHKRRSNLEPSRELTVPTNIPTTAAVLTSAMPISQANPEKDCETPSSTITGQNRGVAENRMSTNPITNLTSFQTTVGWRGLQQLLSSSERKPSPSPDINISLPGE